MTMRRYAPKGTPAEATARLQAALQTALADPEIASEFAELGTRPLPAADATPEALQSRLQAEIARWRPVIESAGGYAD